MSTSQLHNWNLATVSPSLVAPSLKMSSYAAPLTQPRVPDATAIGPRAEWAAEAIENLRHVAKGVGYALAIEGVAALCLYAAWHFFWR